MKIGPKTYSAFYNYWERVIIVFGQHGLTPYIYSHGHNMDKDKDDMRSNSKMVQFSGKIGGVGGGGLTNFVGRGRA